MILEPKFWFTIEPPNRINRFEHPYIASCRPGLLPLDILGRAIREAKSGVESIVFGGDCDTEDFMEMLLTKSEVELILWKKFSWVWGEIGPITLHKEKLLNPRNLRWLKCDCIKQGVLWKAGSFDKNERTNQGLHYRTSGCACWWDPIITSSILNWGALEDVFWSKTE